MKQPTCCCCSDNWSSEICSCCILSLLWDVRSCLGYPTRSRVLSELTALNALTVVMLLRVLSTLACLLTPGVLNALTFCTPWPFCSWFSSFFSFVIFFWPLLWPLPSIWPCVWPWPWVLLCLWWCCIVVLLGLGGTAGRVLLSFWVTTLDWLESVSDESTLKR